MNSVEKKTLVEAADKLAQAVELLYSVRIETEIADSVGKEIDTGMVQADNAIDSVERAIKIIQDK